MCLDYIISLRLSQPMASLSLSQDSLPRLEAGDGYASKGGAVGGGAEDEGSVI